MLGIPEDLMPQTLSEGVKYDAARMAFGESLVKSGNYNEVRPIDRSGYPGFGARGDKVVDRIAHGAAHKLPPLMRVHAGPYLPDRREAVRLFADWTKSLASGGYLDILSIGTSQLTQSNFGESWEGKINGGGVPPRERRRVRGGVAGRKANARNALTRARKMCPRSRR